MGNSELEVHAAGSYAKECGSFTYPSSCTASLLLVSLSIFINLLASAPQPAKKTPHNLKYALRLACQSIVSHSTPD